MQVVHTAGAPPNHGNSCLPRMNCTRKSKNAPRPIATANRTAEARERAADVTAARDYRKAPPQHIRGERDNRRLATASQRVERSGRHLRATSVGQVRGVA